MTRNRVSVAAPAIVKLALERDFEKPTPDGVLNIRGVLEQDDAAPDEAAQAALADAVKAGFADAVSALVEGRAREGAALSQMIAAQTDEIERLTDEAAAHADAAPSAIRERIKAQLDDLLGGDGIPEERLAQEAAILAVKADIREEIDRLRAHIASARALLAEKGPHGRKLDFLTQEFNREANTLCSKAASIALKSIGLALKSVIDQMREQVQNVE
ncbi:MAG: DUF1732 domain-containing protein [Pseudomonadota bacterium]